jgi:hypothetical protein
MQRSKPQFILYISLLQNTSSIMYALSKNKNKQFQNEVQGSLIIIVSTSTHLN